MATTANITPLAGSDGVLYANAVPLTSTEASLLGGTGVQTTDPVPTLFGQAVSAVVQLSITGHITGNNSYVAMQIDMGDGVWIDLNWCVWTGSDGSATFVFSNGIAGANTVQQSRQAGGFPSSSGSNQLCLGGRMRFVGKATAVGGSSGTPGQNTNVIATIRYRLLGLR